MRLFSKRHSLALALAGIAGYHHLFIAKRLLPEVPDILGSSVSAARRRDRGARDRNGGDGWSDGNVMVAADGARFAGGSGIDPDPLACGVRKCLFQSRDVPAVGFLLTQKEDLFAEFNATLYLAETYRRRHFLLGPPTRHNVSEEAVGHLNARLAKTNRYSSSRPIAVQKVRLATTPSLLFGCLGGQKRTISKMGIFVDAHVTDGTGFLSRFRAELVMAVRVMEEQTWYASDWQALVNPVGRLFDIDVAPMLVSAVESTVELDMCREAFREFFEEAAAHVGRRDGGGGRDGHILSANASALFRANPLRARGWVADFDTASFDPGDCGPDSCVVSSIRDSRVAYRVSGAATSPTLAANWRAAQLLTRKYTTIHSVLGQPERVNVAAPDAAELFTGTPAAPGEGGVLLVQRVLGAPGGTYHQLSCGGAAAEGVRSDGGEGNSLAAISKGLEAFAESGAVEDRNKFYDRLAKEARDLARVARRERGFPSTFRLFIDGRGGVVLRDLHTMAFRSNKSGSAADSMAWKCIELLKNLGQASSK